MRFALICGFLLAFATQAVNAERFFSGDTGCADAACDDTADCAVDEGCTKCAGCGPCFIWGKDTFLKVGAGLRASYNAIENGNPNGGTAQDFNVDNARIYMNGQGHKRIGFEFNTDINNAQGFDLHGVNGFSSMDEGELRVLDAIVKFQITDSIGLWVGRMICPSDRANLSGPFFQNAWNFPFTQFGYPNIFQGRDDGAALWGQYGGGVVKWQVGVFEGENSGAPQAIGQPGTDNLMITGRFVVNLLDPEPGYYNASTYYGEKDILALGGSASCIVKTHWPAQPVWELKITPVTTWTSSSSVNFPIPAWLLSKLRITTLTITMVDLLMRDDNIVAVTLPPSPVVIVRVKAITRWGVISSPASSACSTSTVSSKPCCVTRNTIAIPTPAIARKAYRLRPVRSLLALTSSGTCS